MSASHLNMERRLRLELLYAKHAPAVKAYVMRRSPRSGAEGVVAEVFAVCWRRMDDLPLDPLPWLLAAARRALGADGHGTGAARGAPGETRWPADLALGPGDQPLARALAALPDGDRELLLLIGWDGLAPRRAAVVLGASASMVRVRLPRARRRLAAALAREATGRRVGVYARTARAAEATARLVAANPLAELPPADAPERMRRLLDDGPAPADRAALSVGPAESGARALGPVPD